MYKLSNNIESNICKAIDIIVKKAVNQASYDKTIQATILSCVDATIGKYKVKYQDSTFMRTQETLIPLIQMVLMSIY